MERAVASGDLRTSLAVFKGLGRLAGTSPAIGPTDPKDIRLAQADEERRRWIAEIGYG